MTADASRAAPAVGVNAAPTIPPWTVVWMVGALANLPTLVGAVWARYIDLTSSGSYGPALAATPSFVFLRWLLLVTQIPIVFVVVGVLAVLLPHARAAAVERRSRLVASDKPVIAEVEAFLHGHGSDMEVRCNFARRRGLARVYPARWRRARLAVFAPFVVLWRRDRAAAEAVLLHEMAHARAGDHLILGLGSPFVALVNLTVPLFLAFGVLPIVGFAVVGYPTAPELTAEIPLLMTQLPRMLVLPIGALWWAELGADRYVVDAGHRPGLLGAATMSGRRTGRYVRAIAHLSHPPRMLRRWAVSGGRARGTALLAAWPLLVLVQLVLVLCGAVPAYLLAGFSWADTVAMTVTDSTGFLVDSVQIWGPAAALLALWPVVAPWWARCWVRHGGARLTVQWADYVVASAVVAAVMLVLILG